MLEIIATTVEDARRAQAGGADRIELISAMSEGGLTPSYGMIEAVVRNAGIPVNVMIRPHAKSFHYAPEELAVMKRDIAAARRLKANGVVFGALDAAGERVDEAALRDLLSACAGLDVTFHRAIDDIDPVEGMRVLAKYPPITNVLTSGGKGAPEKNAAVLKAMIEHAAHIKVMVGGGLTRENILGVMKAVGAPQYHLGTSVRDDRGAFGEIHAARLAEMAALIKGEAEVKKN